MAFVRTKKIKGIVYEYLVENYRCRKTGKHKQRSLKYLGRSQSQPSIEAKLVTTTTLTIGDEVEIELTLYGDRQTVRGRIIPGSTLSSACAYPRIGDKIKTELIQIPYDVPETFTVQWHHADCSGVVSLPVERIKPVIDN